MRIFEDFFDPIEQKSFLSRKNSVHRKGHEEREAETIGNECFIKQSNCIAAGLRLTDW